MREMVIKFDPPIPNALVVFLNSISKNIAGGGLTNDNGELTIFLPEGTYDLYVVKEEYMPYSAKNVQIFEETSINVTLSKIPEIKPALSLLYELYTKSIDKIPSLPSLICETITESNDKYLDLPTLNYEVEVT